MREAKRPRLDSSSMTTDADQHQNGPPSSLTALGQQLHSLACRDDKISPVRPATSWQPLPLGQSVPTPAAPSRYSADRSMPGESLTSRLTIRAAG